MVSILIPVYNYDITSLVSELYNQVITAHIDFEIIALDDKSSDDILSINNSTNKLKFTNYNLSDKNNGIAITRQLLVNKAKYNWVLLIDADMRLKDSFYISNYINAIKHNYEVVFGGIIYENNPPDLKSLLRWKYGVIYESVSAEKRNKTPYKITSAANMLIKKDVYIKFALDSIGNSYGMDIFFGPQLKLNNIPVLHIDNSVYHLGLESSIKYKEKVEFGVRTLLNLYNKNDIKEHENDLLKAFIFSKKTGLNYIFFGLYKVFNVLIIKNLLSKNPKILLLQYYKILYMCYIDINKNQSN
jgi:hypothetical protein